MLPLPYQLDPLFGSYYSNTSGLFRGDVRYYDLSSIPYDTNVTWRPIVDLVMENANLSTILERLRSWNWSVADTVGIKAHDRMANVSESITIFQVLCPLLCRACFTPKIAPRANSSCSTRRPRVHAPRVRWSTLHEERFFLRVCPRGRVRHAMWLPRWFI